MGKITNLEQLSQTARAAKTFTSGLVGELAEAADKDIAAAKSAADAAKSAAQTAQSTADAAKTAAQTAQNTANAAKAAAVVMKGASASAAGAAGLAPAPAAGAQGKYLRGDGTWQTPPDTNTTYNAATQSANGLMSAADKKKLDGIAANANNYAHPTNSGNKHIPSGGSSGQILRWSADGTAAWGADNNTTYSVATISANGLMSAADKTNLDGAAPKKNPKFSGTMVFTNDYIDPAKLGEYSFLMGNSPQAPGIKSFVAGFRCKSTGDCSFSHGMWSNATEDYSHAEGNYATASGICSHAEGSHTTASGTYSHSEGYYTIANMSELHADGRYNKESISPYDLLIIGNGSSVNSRSNCFRVSSSDGIYGASAFKSTGADYAELMEWQDGNPDAEDRCGKFVTIVGDKIKIASPADNLIMGIISGNPSVVGDVHDDQWMGMYLTDVFGRPLLEDVEVPDETVEEPDPEDPEKTITRVIIPAHTEHRQKLNPNYDNSQPYEPRTKRKEWDAVGMLGKLVAVDDGTCTAGGYCTVGVGGVATASTAQTKYYVMKRLDASHVRVLIL